MEKVVKPTGIPYPSIAPLFDLLVAPVKWAVIECVMELGIADVLAETSNTFPEQ